MSFSDEFLTIKEFTMSENNEEVGKEFREFRKRHELMKQELEKIKKEEAQKNATSPDKVNLASRQPASPQNLPIPFHPQMQGMPPYPPQMHGMPPYPPQMHGMPPMQPPFPNFMFPDQTQIQKKMAPRKVNQQHKNYTESEIKDVQHFIQTLDSLKAFMQKFLDQENLVNEVTITSNDSLKEFTDLRFLMKSDHWPEAMEEGDIVHDNEEEKLHQAAAILSTLVKVDLLEKNVLQFGCKEGHVGYVAKTLFNTKKFVSYDIEKSDNWSKYCQDKSLIYSDKWSDIEKEGPYDAIIIHDIIDHAQEFEKSFQKIISVKNPTGKIFIRCHPWTSRHGCHTHLQVNKAFLHLIFSEDELFGMGIKPTLTNRLLDPLTAYHRLFKAAGLTIQNEKIMTREVELFFAHNPVILKRIKEKWNSSSNSEYASGIKFPREFMEIEFVDFTLI